MDIGDATTEGAGPELISYPVRKDHGMSDTSEDIEGEPELSSTLPADTDVDQLRDGGPPPEKGIRTTTGGTAGPNSFRTSPRSGPGVANTTTGDATTGALRTPPDGYSSDGAQ
jgi:hypothetical protein